MPPKKTDGLFYTQPSSLKPHPKNSRVHDSDQIDDLVQSFKTFGFRAPVLVDKQKRIIAGHACVQAAIRMDMKQIPCIDCSDMTEEQIRGYMIADNQLATKSTWDQSILDDELSDLFEAGISPESLGFDVEPPSDFFNEEETLTVEEIDVDSMQSRFWISVRGPLESQAMALDRLKQVMSEIEGIDVELGTVEL